MLLTYICIYLCEANTSIIYSIFSHTFPYTYSIKRLPEIKLFPSDPTQIRPRNKFDWKDISLQLVFKSIDVSASRIISENCIIFKRSTYFAYSMLNLNLSYSIQKKRFEIFYIIHNITDFCNESKIFQVLNLRFFSRFSEIASSSYTHFRALKTGAQSATLTLFSNLII